MTYSVDIQYFTLYFNGLLYVQFNPNPDVQDVEDTFCADEVADFSIEDYNNQVMVSGSTEGYSFVWDSSSLTIPEDGSRQITNVFNVVVTNNATGCTSEAVVIIYVNPDPEVQNMDDIYCADEAAGFNINNYNDDILVSGNVDDYSFAWTGSLIIPEDGGTQTTNVFDVVVTNNATGCTSEAVLTIFVNPDPYLQPASDILCADEAAGFNINNYNDDVLVSGNVEDYSYTWTGTLTIPEDGTSAVESTFNVVVTDNTTHCPSESYVIITVNPDPAVQSVSDIYCADETTVFDINNYNDDVLASGNVEDHTFIWTGTLTIPEDGTSSAHSTFDVLVTDNITHCASESQVIINVNPDPAVQEVYATYCADDVANFNITTFNDDVMVYSNTKGYTYVWAGSLIIPEEGTSPETSTFNVLVTDNTTNCTSETQVYITVNPDPNLQSFTDTYCADEATNFNINNYNDDILVSGNEEDYTFAWTGSLTIPEDGTSPVESIFNAVVTDNTSNCTSKSQVTITVNPDPAVQMVHATYSADEATDFDIDNFNDDVMVSGKTKGYSYAWIGTLIIPEDGGAITTSTFSVVVTDDETGCTSESQVNITINPDPNVQSAYATYCADEIADFDINTFNDDVMVSGSTSGYSYAWTGTLNIPEIGGESTISIFNVVIIDDGTGSTSESQVTITINSNPHVQNAFATYCTDDVLGFEITTFNDDVMISGLTYGYSYVWTGNLVIPEDGTSPGESTFNVTVTDYNTGCSSESQVAITVNSDPEIQTVFDTYCADETSGFNINTYNDDVLVSGNVEDYTFAWTGNLRIPYDGTTASVSTFNVVVTDKATSCTSESQVIITVNPDPLVQPVTSIYCADDVVNFDITTFNDDVLVSGNVEDYTFDWTGELSIPEDGTLPLESIFNLLVTDNATSCTSETEVTVTVNPDPLLQPVTAIYCADEVAVFDITTFNDDIMVSGNTLGYSYVWTGSLNIPEDGTSSFISTFNVLVTDDVTNCTSETRVIITVNPDPAVQPVTAIYCADEASSFDITTFNNDIMVSGNTIGYSYAWTGSLTIPEDGTSPVESTFDVVVTDDATHCTSETQVTITVNPDPLLQPVTAIYCADEVAVFDITTFNDDIMVSGNTLGYSYVWTGSLNIPEDGTSSFISTFNVLVTDDVTNCTSETHVIITVNPDPALQPVTAIYCADEASSFDITTFNDDIMVSGNTIGYSYAWTGSLTIPEDGTSPVESTFDVVVTNDATHCTSETQVTITVNPDPAVQTASNTYCEDEASNFDITSYNNDVMVSGNTEGYSFEWDGTLAIPEDGTSSAESIFNVVVTDNETGCTSESQVIITVNPAPDVQTISATYCADEATDFDITDFNDDVMISGNTEGYLFVWDGTLTIPEDGTSSAESTFNVVVTDNQTGCTSESQVIITVNPAPAVQTISATYCADEASDFDITSFNDDILASENVEDYTFEWTGALTIPEDGTSPVESTFNVLVTDNTTHCNSESQVIIIVNPNPAVQTASDTYCADEATDFDITSYNNDVMVSGNTEGYSFEWDGTLTIPEDGTSSAESTFNVVVTDNETGCTIESQVIITVNPAPDVQTISATYCADEATDFDITSYNNDVMVSGNTEGYLFAWDGTLTIPEDGTSSAESTFNVVVTDNETGCTSESQVIITVNPAPDVQTISATYCADEATDFDINNYNDDVLASGNVEDHTFIWTGTLTIPEDGTSSAESTFNVVVTDNETGCASESQVIIIVNPNPDVQTISATYCADEATDFDITSYNDDLMVSGNTEGYLFAWDGTLTIPE